MHSLAAQGMILTPDIDSREEAQLTTGAARGGLRVRELYRALDASERVQPESGRPARFAYPVIVIVIRRRRSFIHHGCTH